MTNEDAVKWIKNLKDDIGTHYYASLWYYEQALCEIIELLKEQQDGQWHHTPEERPMLPEGKPFESITVICSDIGYKKTYCLKWERTKLRGKEVYRWKSMYGNICYKVPDFWRYLPEPPNDGEQE